MFIGQLALFPHADSTYVSYLANVSLFMEGLRSFDEIGNDCVPYGWNDLKRTPDTPTANIKPLQDVYIWLGVDTIIYLVLYAYLVQVFPGQFGQSRSYLFPVDMVRERFCSKGKTKPSMPVNVEPPQPRSVVVRVRGLVKTYKEFLGPTKYAVKDVDLDIYRNRITVLLGHNGAGKTTTMSIICGIYPPTEGTVCVDGACDVNEYRNKIGYCPQHNIILPYLTCVQHLYFFGVVRA